MTEATEPAAPPLPTLTGAAQPDALVDGSENEWRVLMESVPLHAETSRLLPSKTFSVASRSPFRTGTIRLSEEGIEIEGMATLPPPRWYALATLAFVLPLFFAQGFSTYARNAGIPNGIRYFVMSLALISMFSPVILQCWLEKRRVETKTMLGWESVRGLQVDPRLRFVTLVFASCAVPVKPVVSRFGGKTEPPPALPHSEYVTLGKLEPPLVAGFAATVEHYAPHVKRNSLVPVNPFIHWLTVALLAVLILGAVVLLAAVFVAVRSRLLSRP